MSSPAFDVEREAEVLRGILREARRGVRDIDDRLERIPVAVMVADDGGHYIAVNGLASDLTGYSRAELLARSVPEMTAPADRHAEERLWRAFTRGDRQEGRFAILRKDGSVVEVHYAAYRDLAPGVHVSFLTRLPNSRATDSRPLV